jgi:DNA-binding response OmpR family regulator
MRILVVEDEKKVASFIQRGLEAEHTRSTSRTTGRRDSAARSRASTICSSST